MTVSICNECNGVVLDDGTVVGCAGTCGREPAEEDTLKPLDFNNDTHVEAVQLEDVIEELRVDEDYDDEPIEDIIERMLADERNETGC